MNENQAVLAHLLKIGVNGFDSFWSIVDNSDEEAHFMHLLAYRVTTAFDLLNQLGGLGLFLMFPMSQPPSLAPYPY
ncbi:uncharacterized protein SN13T_1504 [Lactiplantibacillus plantarum]|nr:uncharacterized protein SN13T_1504 [Lactiplantibacillus plantarum]